MRFGCILLLAAAPAWAQFSGIATTRDGSTVYVASPLRVRGSAQSFNWKIFRLSVAGPELFAEQLPGQRIGWYYENFHDLIAPEVSDDGSVVVFTGTRGCYGGSGCLTVQLRQGTVADSRGRTILTSNGYVDMSPNGRYALFYGRNTFSLPGPAAELVSLGSSERTAFPYLIGGPARRRVTNDGVVAVFKDGAIRLWSAAAETTIAAVSIAGATYPDPILMIGADGRRLVYQTRSGLARYDRAAGVEEVIASVVPASVAIDENAGTVAYVDGMDGQIHLAGRSAAAFTVPERFAQVTLSGDGRVGYAITGIGRLLRLDIASGGSQELIPRTPWVRSVNGNFVPGSLLSVAGGGLSADVRVRIGGLDASVQAVTPEQVWFQVPWEAEVRTAARFELLSGDSPFETGPATVDVQAIAPFVYAGPDLSLIAVHQDWRGLVTNDDPARAGEVIVLYFGGLGSVAPRIATGVAPVDSPPRVTGAFSCQFWDGSGHDANVPFVGLAPGMVGIYQANVQVPAGLKMPTVGVSCVVGPPGPLTTTALLPVAQ